MRISGGFIGITGALAVAAGVAVVTLVTDESTGKGTGGHGRSAQPRSDPAGPDPQAIRVGALLQPNLRSLPAESVRIETNGGRRELRFTSALANVGAGPLEVRPDDGRTCPRGQLRAAQVIYTDRAGDGRFDRGEDKAPISIPAGCMLDHPTHKHWHFDAMARYSLTRPASSAPLVSSEKVSFCLRDSRRMPASPDRPRRHYGHCGRNKVQGISPGWADVYKATLPGQMLELADDLVDGQYCLHSAADPLGLLQETDEDDNAAVLSIRLTGNEVSRGDPAACVTG